MYIMEAHFYFRVKNKKVIVTLFLVIVTSLNFTSDHYNFISHNYNFIFHNCNFPSHNCGLYNVTFISFFKFQSIYYNTFYAE